MEEKLTQLKRILGQVNDLNHTNALLEWDQQVYMPEAGEDERGEQIATISELAHTLFVSDETGQLLEDLKGLTAMLEPYSDDASLVRVTAREYEREKRVPAEKVAEFARVTSTAHGAWAKARQNNDFKHFQPHLEKIVELVKEYAGYFAPYEHVYDPLLDRFEPGMKTVDVKTIFTDLRPPQVELIKAITSRPQVDDSFLQQPFADQKQWDFGIMVAEKFGITWDRSRQDRTAHPFTTTFGQNDVRITTRVHEDLPTSALFSTMHEAGHALYELGFDPKHRRTPLSDAASLAIHESQSRMWENLVGRSRSFWTHFYPMMKETFPSQLGNIEMETFYRAINKVEPSLIRVEADEATYNLHVMLRLEIEIALMEGSIQVKDLPEVWNTKMQDYLGLTPPNDSNGVLQDVHWSAGMIGYFPTYALGNLVSAQLWEKMHQDMPSLEDEIRQGNFITMLEWLRLNIHRHGAKYETQELVQKVTGTKIDPQPYLRYLTAKYSDIYAF
jgi:carboxypeptidase Taq